jgi:hypothetical protein
MYPYNHKKGQKIQTNAPGISVDQAFAARVLIPAAAAVAADTDGVHAALDGTAHAAVTTGITNPAVPRNITATAGGTAGSIKAIQVTITGTNYAGEVITETLPAFTVDTAGTVAGSKAFKTVTQIDIPAHDAASATTAIGWGDIFGLPYLLEADEQVIVKLFNKSADTGTVVADADELEKNTFDPNGTPDGLKDIDLYILV